MRSEKDRDKYRRQIANDIITSKEALEILGFSRMRLSQIVNQGRIEPVIPGIYLKEDIIAFKEERDKSQADPK